MKVIFSLILFFLIPFNVFASDFYVVPQFHSVSKNYTSTHSSDIYLGDNGNFNFRFSSQLATDPGYSGIVFPVNATGSTTYDIHMTTVSGSGHCTFVVVYMDSTKALTSSNALSFGYGGVLDVYSAGDYSFSPSVLPSFSYDYVGFGFNGGNSNTVCNGYIHNLKFNGDDLYQFFTVTPSSTVYVPVNQFVTSLNCLSSSTSSTCDFTYSTSTATSTLEDLVSEFNFAFGIFLFLFSICTWFVLIKRNKR